VTSAPATLWVFDSADLRTNVMTASPPITIPTTGTGTPYPSTNVVSGLTGLVRSVTVTLSNLTHTYAGDLNVLLAAPSGDPVMLLGRAGGGSYLNNATLVFDDDAPAPIPAFGLTTGRYQPTDLADNDLPAPAPGRPYSTNLACLAGINPNGTWSLYVQDGASGDSGVIGDGWSLRIVTLQPAGPVVLAEARVESGVIQFTFSTERGRTYVIEWSETLAPDSWQPLQTVAGDGLTRTFHHACGNAAGRFYRLRRE
jgi:subtilisin-like proprotein convertase family protein